MQRRSHWSRATPVAILAVTSCAPAPHLVVPPGLLSEEWSRPAPAAEGTGLVVPPQLAELIARARAASPTLLVARARIDEARGLLRSARAAGAPVVSASLTGSAARSGQTVDFSGSYATLDAALSLDLNGAQRAGKRSARARLAAAGDDAAWQQVGLAAEVARVYVERAALGARITVLDRGIVQAKELERIVGVRQREGVASKVELGLQSIRVQRLQAERTRLTEAFDQTRTALALLLGEEAPRFESAPGQLEAFVGEVGPLPAPAALVRSRPDILAAEATLRAAGGDVDQARAAFFPSGSIRASLSTASVLNPIATGLALGGNLLAPIFARGRLNGDLDVASARQRAAAYGYRETVLVALKEVEDSLATVEQARARTELLRQSAEQGRLTLKLAQRQYLEGDADLQHLLDAEDLLNSLEDEYVIAQQEVTVARIALIKACGGEIAPA